MHVLPFLTSLLELLLYIYLKCSSPYNSHITRRSQNKLWIPNQKIIGLGIISYVEPRLWNSLPNFLKSAESVNKFKHKSKELFFKNLQDKKKILIFTINSFHNSNNAATLADPGPASGRKTYAMTRTDSNPCVFPIPLFSLFYVSTFVCSRSVHVG